MNEVNRGFAICDSRIQPIGAIHDPQSAIRDPQSSIERPFYVAVEKILGHDERLHGKLGGARGDRIRFLNLLNGLFVDAQNAEAFGKLYRRLAGSRATSPTLHRRRAKN